MSKALEALERNHNFIERYFVKKVEETGVYHKDMKDTIFNDLSTIENELKALEIIKEKRVDIDWFIECLSCGSPLEVYNERYEKIRSCDGKDYHFMQLTQEEYDLLKEVLKNLPQ